MNDDALFRAQVARWNDPQTRADAQAKSDLVRLPRARLESQLRAMERAPKVEQRIFWLREAAKSFGDAVAPHAACRDGCAACCFQPVMVTEAEAKMIARETGARYTEPSQWRGGEPATEYTGKPCTFLRDTHCTIYAHRPFACRVLFNMDRDALLCQIIPGSPIQVPYANAMALNAAYVDAHLDMKAAMREAKANPRGASETFDKFATQLRWADLREFFTEGLNAA